jgi:hypothetical protein
MLTKRPVPTEARDAYYFVEMDARPSAQELENMPQLLVEKILAYKAVKNVVMYGGEVPLG